MSKLKDLTGKKLGRLIVIRREYPNKNGHPRWLCKCDCGKDKIAGGKSLKQGSTRSCGCLRKDRLRLDSGLANMRRRMRSYKYNATKQRNLEWNLTEEQFENITQKDCYYCGAKPNNVAKNPIYFGTYTYNGIDRVDNNKGYTIDNVVPCCYICNQAKHNLTLQDFQDWIKKVYNKMFS